MACEVARRMEGVEGRGARLDEVVGRLGEAVRGGEERVVRRLEAVECGVADGVTGAVKVQLMDAIAAVKEATGQAVERLGAGGVADAVAGRLLGASGVADALRGGVLNGLRAELTGPLKAVRDGLAGVRAAAVGGGDACEARLAEIGRDVDESAVRLAVRDIAGDVSRAMAGQGVRDGAAAQREADMPALVRAQVAEAVRGVQCDVGAVRAKLDALEAAVGRADEKVEGVGRQLLARAVKADNSCQAKGSSACLTCCHSTCRGATGTRWRPPPGGTARACDILIKRVGRSDVRVEEKNFGADKCVGVRDVEKFERDLMQTGIMCCLNSGIVQHDSAGSLFTWRTWARTRTLL